VIAIFGGGEIATKGIRPVVHDDCWIVDQDVRCYPQIYDLMAAMRPTTVIVTAGVSHPKTIAESDPADWQHEISVNLLGSYNVAKAAVDVGVTNLIFIASVAGLYGKPNHSGYSASKGGVISLVQSLAMEGHHAWAISPGRVDTTMREADYPGEDPRTRLDPKEIGVVVQSLLDGHVEPGANVIVRKIGFDVYRRVDRGEPWRTWLKVGEPVVV